MKNRSILAINTGSSSLKASLFKADGTRHNFNYSIAVGDIESHCRVAFTQLFNDIKDARPTIIAHRFVHGGDVKEASRRLDKAELKRLHSITYLAPLHLPISLLGVVLCQAHFRQSAASMIQAACFDTAFHLTMPALAKVLPISSHENMQRYGFHGLSYAYLAAQLPALLGQVAYGRVVLAHLGAGASLCMLNNLQSIDTTMGFTPAGGVCMATRSGDLDPGVMLALARRYDIDTLNDITQHKMGLIALSNGESSDMKQLLKSPSLNAQLAVDYFCRDVSAAIGSLAAKAGGIDALILSGGISEHEPLVRAKICAPLGFMGINLDEITNVALACQPYQQLNLPINQESNKPILCIKTDEELMMAELVKCLLD